MIVRPLTLLLLLLTLAACDEPSTPPPPAHTQTVGDDNLRVRLTLSNDEPTLAERVTLTIAVTSPANAEQPALALPLQATPEGWPDRRSRLGGLVLIDATPTSATLLEGGRRRATQTLTLEPFLPGEHEIPPMELGVELSATASAAVRTDPIPVRVAGALPVDASEPELSPLRARPDEPAPPPLWRQPWSILILAIALVAGVFTIVRTRPAPKAPDIAGVAQKRLEAMRTTPSGATREHIDEVATLLAMAAQSRTPSAPGARFAELAPRLGPSLRPDAERLAADLDAALYQPDAGAEVGSITSRAADLAGRLHASEAPA